MLRSTDTAVIGCDWSRGRKRFGCLGTNRNYGDAQQKYMSHGHTLPTRLKAEDNVY